MPRRVGCLVEGLRAWVRSAPGTYVYFFALVVTSWSLRSVDPRLADAMIRSQSTNLDNLTDRPLQVLVASAFWTSGSYLPWQLLLRFSLVLAPVERRLGTFRTLVVFAAGHIGSTLLVAAGLRYRLHHHQLDLSVVHASDVGVSYGLVAVAGAMTWLLVPQLWRVLWVGLLVGILVVAPLGHVTFTDVGHMCSLVIGLASAPLIVRWQRRSVPRAVLPGRPIRLSLGRLRARREGVGRSPADCSTAGSSPSDGDRAGSLTS